MFAFERYLSAVIISSTILTHMQSRASLLSALAAWGSAHPDFHEHEPLQDIIDPNLCPRKITEAFDSEEGQAVLKWRKQVLTGEDGEVKAALIRDFTNNKGKDAVAEAQATLRKVCLELMSP